jgi:hypothetical protein
MRTQTTGAVNSGAKTSVKSVLDEVRAAAQELHGAITDAVSKRGGATKADAEAFGQKIKTITELAKSSMTAQNEATKKYLAGAVTELETTQKHFADGVKTSGEAFQTSMRQVSADVRTSVQKISEAVAAARSAASTKTH